MQGKKSQEQLQATPEKVIDAKGTEEVVEEGAKGSGDDDKSDLADGATKKDDGGTGTMFTTKQKVDTFLFPFIFVFNKKRKRKRHV